MTRWVTKYLGIKDAKSRLSTDEYGSIILDLRDMADGSNPPELLARIFGKVFATVASAKKLGTRVILQCEGGISRSPAMVAAIFVYANDMEWEDALDLVKKKVPEAQISLELLDSFKEAFGQV